MIAEPIDAIVCLNGHEHPTWADAETCDRQTDLTWTHHTPTIPAAMRTVSGYRVELICPQCGSGDFYHINGTPNPGRSQTAITQCVDCHRQWAVLVTLASHAGWDNAAAERGRQLRLKRVGGDPKLVRKFLTEVGETA